MATDIPVLPHLAPALLPAECLPNYELLVTEDDKPVDSIYAERQHLLLTSTLIDSWPGPTGGGPRFIATDVGLFYSVDEPAFAPDVMVAVGVAPPRGDQLLKKYRSYFIWLYGKPPDIIVEVVSNTEGGELTTKLEGYARIGVTYYVVWDPHQWLGEKKLHCFVLQGGSYVPCEPYFPRLELGVTIWEGSFFETPATYLRWCNRDGQLLLTGAEAAAAARKLVEAEQQRTTREAQRAEQEKQRADKLAEKLRSLGIDPDKA